MVYCYLVLIFINQEGILNKPCLSYNHLFHSELRRNAQQWRLKSDVHNDFFKIQTTIFMGGWAEL